MIRSGIVLLIIALTTPSLAMAETTSFADSAALLARNCSTEITANCRGVNFDGNRLKECLTRNQDVATPQCKSSYLGVFDAIQKRVAARITVANACAREIVKLCGGSTKETSKAIPCVVADKRAYKGCTNALVDAGYQPPAAATRDDIIAKLDRFETAADIDVAALRQQVAERSKSRSKNEPPPQKRPPIAPELTKLPAFNADIKFDVDTPIVLPPSYQMLGEVADAMTHPSLLPYTFLIVGHIDATGRRENNVLLSQRRADAVRDMLVNTYKISAKRLQSVGLGEEQLLDPARPNAPVNNQLQIMTVSKLPEQSEQPATPKAKGSPSAAKKPAKKR